MTAAAPAAALAYAKRHGWAVFPCAPRSKNPVTAHGKDDATTDEATIRTMFRNSHNVAVAAEPSGLIVIDVDDDQRGGGPTFAALVADLGPLPPTVTAATGSGGAHYLFRAPAGDTIGKLGRGVEVIRRGYIMTAPSIHPNGRAYAWRPGHAPGEIDLAELPPAWLARMRRPDPPPATKRPRPTTDDHARILKRASAYLAKMPPAISGQGGHHAAFLAAVAMVRGFDLDAGVAFDLLATEYNPRCEPPWSERELRHKIDGAERANLPRGYLLADPDSPEPSPIDRAKAFAVEAEASIAAFAARDDEPATMAATGAAPSMRWTRPLADVLGIDEPSADDREDWIIRDVIPRGEPAIWAGPPKAGKTWAALDLAMCVARGVPWLDGAFENTLGAPARVLVVALEDGRRRLGARLWELARGHGTTPNAPAISENLSIAREPLRLAGDEREFAAELRRWRPAVVVIDCLTRVMVGDQNAIRDVAAFTALWSRMCSDVGASITFLHHTGKASGDPRSKRDPFDSIRGSGDLVAAARNVVVAQPMGIDGAAVSDVRMRGNLDLHRDRFALGFERSQQPDGRWSARLVDRGDVDALRAAATDERQAAMRDQRAHREAAALEIARTQGAVSKATLAARIGMSPGTAATVLREMAANGALVRHGQAGYVLPGGVQ